ncbi:MAG: hypothetical protein ACI9XB_005336, partial [Gammaproteobacteria bacterium]
RSTKRWFAAYYDQQPAEGRVLHLINSIAL